MGWFGFNSGSAFAANARAGYAGVVTTVAASSGAITWVLFDYARTKKMSGIAFCSGAIAGLVGITPSSGFCNAWSAIIIGVITSFSCCFSIRIKDSLGYDDSADAWGIHGKIFKFNFRCWWFYWKHFDWILCQLCHYRP